MRRLFKSTTKPLIGLDVAVDSLNWVELARDDKTGLVLERCAMEPLPVGWMVAGHIVQFDDVVAALRRLIKTSGSRTRQVALAMPDTAVIVSKIRCASDLGPAELLRQVAAEVERLSGKPLTDMCVDYKAEAQGQGVSLGAEVDVWIAACTQEKMQDRVGLAEAAGLEAVVLDVAAEASMLAARRLTAAKDAASASPAMALIQVDNEGCSLHVICQGEMAHAVHQPLASAHLMEHSVPADLQPFTQSLADRLASELDGFLAASPRRKLDTILLAGGSSWLPVLHQAIQQRTFSDCVLVDAFSGMRVHEAVQNASLHAAWRSSMLTACGLALRRFHGAC